MTPQRLPKGLPDPGLNDPDVDREPKPEGEERKGLNQRDVNTATILVFVLFVISGWVSLEMCSGAEQSDSAAPQPSAEK